MCSIVLGPIIAQGLANHKDVIPWGGWDLNPRSSGYEPAALTSLATAPCTVETARIEPTTWSASPSQALCRAECENIGVDVWAWSLLVAALVAVVVLIAFAPAIKRDHRRRQLAGGGGMAGLGGGMDAVWRPSAEEAHADWQAQVEVPAPAPAPGDKSRLTDGRIVIDIPRAD